MRACVPKPIQCDECKIFAHVSSVCRQEDYRMPAEPKCCNCGDDHAVMIKFPVSVKAMEVARIRAVQHVSYPEKKGVMLKK